MKLLDSRINDAEAAKQIKLVFLLYILYIFGQTCIVLRLGLSFLKNHCSVEFYLIIFCLK